MPLEVQAKLLRILEDHQVDRVGGAQAVPVDVRLIPTNADLAQAVAERHFRADLYYRLKVFPIMLPPLRDRGEDIPLLAQHFLQLCRVKLNRSNLILVSQPWHGWRNMTGLEISANSRTSFERAAILAPTHIVEIDERVAISYPTRAAVTEQPITLHDSESLHIRRVLEQVGWRIYGPLGAANRLGINPSTLRSRMKKLGLSRPTSLVPIDQLAPSYSSVMADHPEFV